MIPTRWLRMNIHDTAQAHWSSSVKKVMGHQPLLVVVVLCMKQSNGAHPLPAGHTTQLSHPECREPEAQPHDSGTQTDNVQAAASFLLAAVTSLSRAGCTCRCLSCLEPGCDAAGWRGGISVELLYQVCGRALTQPLSGTVGPLNHCLHSPQQECRGPRRTIASCVLEPTQHHSAPHTWMLFTTHHAGTLHCTEAQQRQHQLHQLYQSMSPEQQTVHLSLDHRKPLHPSPPLHAHLYWVLGDCLLRGIRSKCRSHSCWEDEGQQYHQSTASCQSLQQPRPVCNEVAGHAMHQDVQTIGCL